MKKQDQRVNDPSFRSTYHWLAADFGIQYYLVARSAVAAAFNPVSGSIAHHAVEMLLKSCLAKDDTGETIAKYITIYRHNLKLLWAEFRRRNQHLNLDPDFDLIIEAHTVQRRLPKIDCPPDPRRELEWSLPGGWPGILGSVWIFQSEF